MNQLQTTNKVYAVNPQNYKELLDYATVISKSSICPKCFAGRPGDVLVAIQMGAELGLAPMQAIQNMAIINGKPSVYGDMALALIKTHQDFVEIKEWSEGDISLANFKASCEISRRGNPTITRSFSMQQAKTAKLWGKTGPWTDYPERMFQMRARSFAMRDQFPDALKGLSIVEDIQEIKYVGGNEITQKDLESSIIDDLNEESEIAEISEIRESETIESITLKINNSNSIHELIESVKFISDLNDSEKESLKILYKQKKEALLPPEIKTEEIKNGV